VNRRREVCEWEGEVCVREGIGAPSMVLLIRRSVALARMCNLRFDLGVEKPRGANGPSRVAQELCAVYNK
jgi:hypothetical protein